MIPLVLHLRNFMCYREATLLDLTGIHLACLAGDNGHGKSALLDAMTWALWGRSRARHDDELVSLGEKEMEVELEFLLDGTHYRVIRKRELARRSRGALEFQIKGNGDFRSFTAGTQRETQSRIVQVLRVDYDTFINSAFLVQGRADEFTVKQPAERKRILADILGLSIYDEYEQRAKSLARDREQAQREAEVGIQEINRELDHRPEYKRELEAAQAELAQLTSQAQVAERALQEVRGKLHTLEAQKTQLADVSERIRNAEAQLRELDEQVKAQSKRITAGESVLERRKEILAGHAQLRQARTQEAEFGVKLSQLLALNEEKARIEKQITVATKDLELEQQVAKGKLSDLEQLAQRLPAIETELGKVHQEMDAFVSLQAKMEGARAQITDLRTETATLEAQNRQLRLEMTELQEKIRLLQEPAALCPLCGQDVTQDERLRLLAELEEEGGLKGNVYRGNTSILKKNSEEVAALESEAERIKRALGRLPALQGQEATLRQTMEQARAAASEAQEQRTALTALEERLENGDFVAAEQTALAGLEKRIEDLDYSQATHDTVRQAVTTLARFESDKAELDKTQEIVAELRRSRQQLQRTHQQRTPSLEADKHCRDELVVALSGFKGLDKELVAREQEVNELRAKRGRARQMVGATQQKLDRCLYLDRERKKRTRQLRKATKERGLYQELQQAFGKRGVQALIIESVVPEIEDEANALLGHMTEGRMSVHFETQRDSRQGNTIETLDIRIADENGPRSYELYSGGEAFRINFAIRIALSKLLARRAGAQLQTLIIDEGFGAQDSSGRQSLVEAINSIKDEFARILVITHIEELKDAFPVRIDVFKTPRGSQITIN